MTLKILLTCMCLATCSLGNGPGAPADPRLADITPDGVQRGTEATIELRGSRLKGPLEFFTKLGAPPAVTPSPLRPASQV